MKKYKVGKIIVQNTFVISRECGSVVMTKHLHVGFLPVNRVNQNFYLWLGFEIKLKSGEMKYWVELG